MNVKELGYIHIEAVWEEVGEGYWFYAVTDGPRGTIETWAKEEESVEDWSQRVAAMIRSYSRLNRK